MLTVEKIFFSYSDEVTLNDISFSVPKGDIVALMGESGCGKSTLLKLIYGLYDLDAGHILWNSTEVLGPKFHLIPGMPYMKYLAQDFDLMPFITVAENVGKFLSNFFPEEKKKRIAELLAIVEMSEFAEVKAQFLSGGQMQRVAIARALALEPEVLLLDEPFSHIDNFRKNSLRRKLFGYLKEKNITCLVATHDSKDVLSYAVETIVLQNGQLLKKELTQNLYRNPDSRYTAALFDEVNEISVSILEDSNSDKTILIYPYQLKIAQKSKLRVEVRNNYFKGSCYLIEAIHDSKPIFFENPTRIDEKQLVYLRYEK